MKRIIFCLTCILVGITLSFSVQAQTPVQAEKIISPKISVSDFREPPLLLVDSVFAIPDWHRYIFKLLDVLFATTRIAITCLGAAFRMPYLNIKAGGIHHVSTSLWKAVGDIMKSRTSVMRLSKPQRWEADSLLAANLCSRLAESLSV